MNQQIRDFKEKNIYFWNSVSKKRRFLYIGIFIAIIVALSLSIFFLSKSTYVPLFTNEMSQKEIGDIKAELDQEGYTDYKLDRNGTTILVPQEDVDQLLVSLASKGLPKTGTISFFDMTKDLQFGATDRQLDAMEKEALQGEVADLLRHVEGVKNAAVVLTTPQESLFVQADEKEQASASAVIELEPGYELEPKEIQVLYHLVSKSVPNLPKENIVMTDQGGQGLDLPEHSTGALDNFDQQRKIQKDIEADIQKDLQQMLGTIMGHNKVLVQAFVRLNFDQVKTREDLVEPSAENEGIAVSVEEVSKKYSGKDTAAGVDGTGETDIAGYAGTNPSQENTSEELEKRVNYEVNRITNEIVQSPYKIEDLTINVGVEPPDPDKPASLTNATKENIQQILSNVVRTALSSNPALTNQDIQSRITVFSQEFNGKAELPIIEEKSSIIPAWAWWKYALIGTGGLVILMVLFALVRRRKSKEEEDDPFPIYQEVPVKPVELKEDEKVAIKKQVEQMAMQQPEEFVGLLRNWLSRD
ncbi:flagellar M-ring protein FliF [Bacillus sp. EB106-08-02-XG196]|uniref:flagellar basal-body MS-ring/collar protein FliF n=1 Tax=Bacillus sp. EB106-08-02-XG196 TaxID=2737049 RepID=UPI0015C4A4C3|nr:flagellar basal-body MS-ring/collar protein FliF [Bacillus sp. EB106-08-02-XG196]NWQ39665.1 flagellar M-ring protein FliF [Bacillus sp. EB106-08-02-XG196]